MEETSAMTYVVYGVFGLIALVALFTSFFTVKENHRGVVERFGKFNRVVMPGLNFKIPIIESYHEWSLEIFQMKVEVETKTEDNVFVKLVVPVMYFTIPDKVKEAFYKLAKPVQQIESYVFDVVRSQVPAMKLDEVFQRKDEIANAVKRELADAMDDYGYGITKALVTDIDPDEKVKKAMNDINAATRERVAASERGEAERILAVKRAEGEKETKRLNGEGIASQRKAIIEGLKDSVELFQKAVEGATAKDVMNLVVTTQYFDTLKEIGASNKATTILIPHSPGSVGDVSAQLRNSMIAANATNGAHHE